jgi:DnaJ-class molecular chaperone
MRNKKGLIILGAIVLVVCIYFVAKGNDGKKTPVYTPKPNYNSSGTYYNNNSNYNSNFNYGSGGSSNAVVPKRQICSVCRGTGSCTICRGSGTYRNYGTSSPCSACDATGDCWNCNGSGYAS